MWHCTRGLTAYLQQLIYSFSQSPTLYWVSTDPGQDSILHVKSHYMRWRVSQSSSLLTSLFLECVVIL